MSCFQNNQTLNRHRTIMRRRIIACSVIVIFLLQSWSIATLDLSKIQSSKSVHKDVLFNQSGFTVDGVYTDTQGNVKVSKPFIKWSTSNTQLITRTGACSVAVDSLDEVWIIGGREDPNPTQNNDEVPTNVVEILDNQNKTWSLMDNFLPFEQEYCEAEIVDDLVVVVGDWPRNSNPVQDPTGRVQVYNLSNETWYNGKQMTQARGLGAMAEAGGYLYYAGGVKNQNANDASNVTLRYDPTNDLWSRMADMNQPRASFELVNYHGYLYAMGGFQGTQTWNRQALDYVERYDPSTDTWTNLSKLPVAMFGWSGSILNDEIVLVGGYNGVPKNTVYHWNPIEDTWSKGNNIAPSGHFDVIFEEINGSVVWASGDTSSNAYGSWSQSFSNKYQFQNKTSPHVAWLNSPVIDLRPNSHSKALPVQIDVSGMTPSNSDLRYQYRTSSISNTITSEYWSGPDGTINTTFTKGVTNINLAHSANFIQYRIMFVVNELETWIEPELDSVTINADHAGFTGNIPEVVNPLSTPVVFQTTHDSITDGDMSIEFSFCDSFGALQGDWSKLVYDGTSMAEIDSENIVKIGTVKTNSSTQDATVLNWSIVFEDLQKATHICIKAATEGINLVEYYFEEPIEIDNQIELNINEITGVNLYNTTVGGTELSIGLDNVFPSTNSTLYAGDLQARAYFNIQEFDAEGNQVSGWTNHTTPWQSLSLGGSNSISWTAPTELSGLVHVSIDGFSNNSLQVLTNPNPVVLTLDNSNPILMSTSPELGSYIDSEVNRDVSILIADVSGFDFESVSMQTWVESVDDGLNGSSLDGLPQEIEYKDINYTLENYGSFWWFNGTISDAINEDKQLVYMRVIGNDLAGLETSNATVWWKSRDASTSNVERIYNVKSNKYWEVSRDISWDIVISDKNNLSDILSVEIQFGGSPQFGVIYHVTDGLCSSLGISIDSEKTSCSHSYSNGEMVLSTNIYSTWEIDIASYIEGFVEITVTDIDGLSKSTFNNLWIYSEEFNLSINKFYDESGVIQGEISNNSITQTGDVIRITGNINHAYSNTPYEGELLMTWLGYLQGANWYGSSAVEVFNGQINTTIAMPLTGGLMDFRTSFLDPHGGKTIAEIDVPIFEVDSDSPIILDPNVQQLSRYSLNDVGIGVNIQEDVSWTGLLTISCQVISTEITWEPITISLAPSAVFQGKTLFSFAFDFSQQGDPSLLSPEAELNCWAEGKDDAGWPLSFTSELADNQPWLSIPLTSDGPNIELLNVKLDGEIEAGRELRAEITIKNSGDSLEDSFNISVYTIVDGEKTLVGLYSQSKINPGQGIVKRVGITIPEGDWEILVVVDEDQKIWELNEEDNTFTKSFSSPENADSLSYILICGGFIATLLAVLILRKRSGNEMKEPKQLPTIEDLPRSGPPQAQRSTTDNQYTAKAKTGPPPKQKLPEPNVVITNVADAMAKLSLDTLPGRDINAQKTVPSYESLPPGGDYEYLNEGTFYIGSSLGRWKLNEDGSFTKVE